MAYCIPDYIMEGMREYVDGRHPVGGFLLAVFRNDLTDAVCRADDKSLAAIVDIVKWVYNEAPSLCHGSRERVNRWLKRTEMEEVQDDLR